MTKTKQDRRGKGSKADSGRTLVTFLLDRSGSMNMVKAETITGFNIYLDHLRGIMGAGIEFTLVTFDSEGMDKICVCEPVAIAPRLNEDNYQPRACTPLIDAAYDTIKAVEGQERAKGAKIIVCIQTDGHENSSHAHSASELKSLIEAKQKLGWQFNFMGCGFDAYDQAAAIGVTRASTMSYSSDAAHTEVAFRASAHNTVQYAAGLSSGTNYTVDQKVGAGDIYDTAAVQPFKLDQPTPRRKTSAHKPTFSL